MRACHPSLPCVWLLSDARNDNALEAALRRLPPGSGFVFRHYHLAPEQRHARFRALAGIARDCGHLVLLSGPAAMAVEWGADGIYGAAAPPAGDGLLRLATAHDVAEVEAANGARVDGVFLSPVFRTRSHPGAPALGPAGFHALARRAAVPAIALGGMTAARAQALGWPRWGAIDGLAAKVD